jgi:hypothetical protein
MLKARVWCLEVCYYTYLSYILFLYYFPILYSISSGEIKLLISNCVKLGILLGETIGGFHRPFYKVYVKFIFEYHIRL